MKSGEHRKRGASSLSGALVLFGQYDILCIYNYSINDHLRSICHNPLIRGSCTCSLRSTKVDSTKDRGDGVEIRLPASRVKVQLQLDLLNFTIILSTYIIMSQQESEAGPSTSPTPTTLEETLNSLDINDSTESNTNTKVKSKNRKSKSKSNEPKPILAPKPKALKPVPTPIQAFENPAEGEEETVHGVYESIAPHFSQTRHKVCEVR
jgi:hypothetical protein